jgi:ribosomal protein S18 acetylase RimI-like enzyme
MQAMKHKFIIARHAAKPFGFASIEPNFRETKQVMIHKLYLLPAFQGKGYGKKFIDYITKLAVDSGSDSLCLKVFHKNTPGIAFYERIGFLISAEEKTLFENGYEILDYVMSKKITL